MIKHPLNDLPRHPAESQDQEQEAPKYATIEDLEALRGEIEKIKRQTGKGKKSDDE